MKTSDTFLDAGRETRVFLLFMTLIVGGMYVFVIAEQPEMRQPLPFIVFTLLVIIQLALHWMLPKYAERPGWTFSYVVLQGILALVTVLMTQSVGLAFALFLGLIGEAIGIYSLTKGGFIATLYYLLLSLGSFLYMFGPQQFAWWMLGIIPSLIFVIIYVELYNRQMNANERARKLLGELEAANRQLSDYAAQVEDLTIAAERQRMARELHDTLSQGLAGLILQLEAADAHLASERPQKAHLIVQQTMVTARLTLDNARRAIDDLRNEEPTNLEAAILAEVERLHYTAGVPCQLDLAIPQDLPAPLIDPLLRIITESLANIARHARATEVTLRLVVQNGALALEICDNGTGFSPDEISSGHYGLIGMRERARLAGGEIEIDSIPGRGTTLRLNLPLS